MSTPCDVIWDAIEVFDPEWEEIYPGMGSVQVEYHQTSWLHSFCLSSSELEIPFADHWAVKYWIDSSRKWDDQNNPEDW